MSLNVSTVLSPEFLPALNPLDEVKQHFISIHPEGSTKPLEKETVSQGKVLTMRASSVEESSKEGCCCSLFKHWAQAVSFLGVAGGIAAVGSGFGLGLGLLNTGCSAASALALKWGLVSAGGLLITSSGVTFFVIRNFASDQKLSDAARKVSEQVVLITKNNGELRQTVQELSATKGDLEKEILQWTALEERSKKAMQDSKAISDQLNQQLVGEKSANEKQAEINRTLEIQLGQYTTMLATLEKDAKAQGEEAQKRELEEKHLKEAINQLVQEKTHLTELNAVSSKETERLLSLTKNLQEELEKARRERSSQAEQMGLKEKSLQEANLKLVEELQETEKKQSIELKEGQEKLQGILKAREAQIGIFEKLLQNPKIQAILVELNLHQKV